MYPLESEVAQLCLTLCDPMGWSHGAYQAPPSMGFSRQECWSGLPFPSPGDLPDPGIKSGSPTLQADTLPSEPLGKLVPIRSHCLFLPPILSPTQLLIYFLSLHICVVWTFHIHGAVYNMGSFMMDIFYPCFHYESVLSFVLLNSILLYEYIVLCLSLDISIFCPLWTV